MALRKLSRTLKLTAAAATVGMAVGVSVLTGPVAEGKVYGTQAEGAVQGNYIVMLKGGESVAPRPRAGGSPT